MSKRTEDQLPGQMSIFDYLGGGGTDVTAGSGTPEPDPWRALKPSDRKLNKAVKDAKNAIRGLREAGKPKESPKPQEIRQPCGRPCDVECFSKTCFIRRGQIWHPEGRHNWLRDENGKIIIGPKQCDWMPVNHSGVNATFECFAEYPTESGGIHFGECEKGIEPGQKRNCEGCEVHRKFYEIAREYQEQGKTWGEAVALTCYLVGVHTIAEYTPDAYMYGIKYDESADEWIPKNWRKGGENGRTKKI